MLYTLRTNVAPKRAVRVPETLKCLTYTLIFTYSMSICRALHVPGIRELEFHQSHNPKSVLPAGSTRVHNTRDVEEITNQPKKESQVWPFMGIESY